MFSQLTTPSIMLNGYVSMSMCACAKKKMQKSRSRSIYFSREDIGKREDIQFKMFFLLLNDNSKY